MKQGFIKTAAGTIEIAVADTDSNTDRIIERIKEADGEAINLLVLPELCLTGYTCGDLFFSDRLLDSVEPALNRICEATRDLYPITVLGLPFATQESCITAPRLYSREKYWGLFPKPTSLLTASSTR